MAKKKNGAASMSKMDAVKRALAEGKDSRTEGIVYVKETFGIELSPNHFSNYKSKILAGGKPKKRRGRKPGRKPATVENAVPAQASRAPGGIDLESIQRVKELVGRFGAETVKKLVTLVG